MNGNLKADFVLNWPKNVAQVKPMMREATLLKPIMNSPAFEIQTPDEVHRAFG